MEFKMEKLISIIFIILTTNYSASCVEFKDENSKENAVETEGKSDIFAGKFENPVKFRDSPATRHSHRHFWRDINGNISILINGESFSDNFLIIDYLADGEMERRISYNGLAAKETSVGYNTSKTLTLWQVTNGYGFIQLIYTNSGDLVDCEYVRQKHVIHAFLTKFNDDFNDARARNFTSRPLPKNMLPLTSNYEFDQYLKEGVLPEDYSELQEMTIVPDEDLRNLTYKRIGNFNDVPEDMRPWLNFNDLKRQCHQRHREMRKIVQGMSSHDKDVKKTASEHLERKKRDISNWLMAPNTKWCGRGQNAGGYNKLGGASRADKCCRKHDHCKLNIQGLTSKWQLFNYHPYTISHCNCDTRHRRDLSSLLRVPGTKWCGKGWSAAKYADLGGYSKADRCCRQHDKSCPYWIMGFQTKFNLYNWRVSTLMHCKCDERFRTCLKMADSPDANMVGKLFFNVMATKCFVLKPEKVCKKRSWWGDKCEKRVVRKRAILRDNRRF